MKKYLPIIILLIIAIVGVYQLRSYSAQKEVGNYIEKISSLNKEEDKILKDFEKSFVDEKDEDKKYSFLTSHTIPDYEKYVNDVKKVKEKNSDLKTNYGLYLQNAEDYLNVLKDYKNAIKLEENTLFNNANEKTSKINQKMKEQRENLEKIARENRIQIK